MKKPRKISFLTIAIVVCVIGIWVGYANLSKDKYYDVRKAVWSQLSEEAKGTVLQNWEKAKVNEVGYGEVKELEIIFKAPETSLLGDLIVYVDPTTFKILSIKGRA